jgi:hypothetical protein
MNNEPTVITTEKVEARAAQLAKEAGGDDRDWAAYIPRARKQLYDEAEAYLKKEAAT